MTSTTQASGDSHRKDEQEIHSFCPESYSFSFIASNENWHQGYGNGLHITC